MSFCTCRVPDPSTQMLEWLSSIIFTRHTASDRDGVSGGLAASGQGVGGRLDAGSTLFHAAGCRWQSTTLLRWPPSSPQRQRQTLRDLAADRREIPGHSARLRRKGVFLRRWSRRVFLWSWPWTVPTCAQLLPFRTHPPAEARLLFSVRRGAGVLRDIARRNQRLLPRGVSRQVIQCVTQWLKFAALQTT